MAQIKFIRGTKAQYDALIKNTDKANDVKNSVFFVTDEHCIMMDGKQYGGVDNEMFKGFIKDVDVEGNVLSFKRDVDGTWTDVSIKLLEAADNSIVVGDILKDGGVKDGSTIKVNVKAVGKTADGLKLGADGLYVNLTNTTKSITDETARAKAAEGANAANIATNTAAITTLNAGKTTSGSVDNKIDTAINGLDVNLIGGEGKFVKSVSETDGKIAAEVGDLVSTAVARTATTDVTGQVDMTGTTVEGALVDLAKAVSETNKNAATYKITKVTTGLATNVKEAYQLVQTVNGQDTNIDVQIPIYKDQTLKSVELVAEDDKKKKGQFMKYTYINADGADTIVYVDCSKLLAESEFKNGLALSDAGEVSVKIDATSESFLTVGEGGVKLSGVQNAINTAKTEIIDGATNTTLKALEDKLAEESEHARAAEKANADAITVLNGTEAVEGSVAKSVADAKKELLGDAAEGYNTLGKLEDKIQAVDAKASSAHTEVVAKAEGHVRVAVADSTDKTHKVVTISENDIASAAALTTEVNRAKAAEDTIEASVGLAADGSHKNTTGHYTSGASTVVGEIAALDTQVKANADAIAANANTNLNLTTVGGVGKVITTVSQTNGQVSATAIDLVASAVTRTATDDVTGKTVEAALSELATAIKAEANARKDADTTISGNVTTNTNAIATLNGEETAAGSVKHTAKTYVDEALNWIDAGTYGTEA